MLLYHFTARENLSGIMRSGLGRGIVHVSPTHRINGVWLTTRSTPDGHGLEAGGAFMSDDQRREGHQWSGTLPPPGARFPKDASVRITVELPPGDPDLHEWLPWARRRISPEWMAILHPIASGAMQKAKTWRLYFGVIPPTAFVAVDAHKAERQAGRASAGGAGS